MTAIAFDTSNQQDPSTSGATSRYPIYPGDLPPTVDREPVRAGGGHGFTDGRIFVSGRFEDDQQIAEAEVAIRNGARPVHELVGHVHQHQRRAGATAFLNSPGSPGSNFSYTTPVIPTGSYTVLVRGDDQHGFVTPCPASAT